MFTSEFSCETCLFFPTINRSELREKKKSKKGDEENLILIIGQNLETEIDVCID